MLLHDTDMLGRKVDIPFPPKRIISVVPSQTELLYDLGLDKEVIGITRFCIRPEKWFRTKQRIGGTKQLRLDAIQALKPDLILANKEENSRADLEALSSVFPVWISDIRTVQEALKMIAAVGRITGRNPEQLIESIAQGLQELVNAGGRKLRVAYFIWYNPWMAAGNDTYIHHLLELMGWENVFGHLSRYPEVTEDLLRELSPELILLSSEPFPFKKKQGDILRDLLPTAEIVHCDGEMFSWYGSRMLPATGYLKALKTSYV